MVSYNARYIHTPSLSLSLTHICINKHSRDTPLEWETTDKKVTVLTSADTPGGPSTLRKSTAPLTESRRLQIARDVLVKQLPLVSDQESSQAVIEPLEQPEDTLPVPVPVYNDTSEQDLVYEENNDDTKEPTPFNAMSQWSKLAKEQSAPPIPSIVFNPISLQTPARQPSNHKGLKERVRDVRLVNPATWYKAFKK